MLASSSLCQFQTVLRLLIALIARWLLALSGSERRRSAEIWLVRTAGPDPPTAQS